MYSNKHFLEMKIKKEYQINKQVHSSNSSYHKEAARTLIYAWLSESHLSKLLSNKLYSSSNKHHYNKSSIKHRARIE
jgi:hypothetical protein